MKLALSTGWKLDVFYKTASGSEGPPFLRVDKDMPLVNTRAGKQVVELVRP